MKKLLVYLDEDFHEDLRELAHRKKTSMASLVRYALDFTFEDDLDTISSERSLEEYLRDPSSAITLDDYLKERGIVLPGRHYAPSSEEPEARPAKASGANSRRHPTARRRAVS
jgi:hypothetical protein